MPVDSTIFIFGIVAAYVSDWRNDDVDGVELDLLGGFFERIPDVVFANVTTDI